MASINTCIPPQALHIWSYHNFLTLVQWIEIFLKISIPGFFRLSSLLFPIATRLWHRILGREVGSFSSQWEINLIAWNRSIRYWPPFCSLSRQRLIKIWMLSCLIIWKASLLMAEYLISHYIYHLHILIPVSLMLLSLSTNSILTLLKNPSFTNFSIIPLSLSDSSYSVSIGSYIPSNWLLAHTEYYSYALHRFLCILSSVRIQSQFPKFLFFIFIQYFRRSLLCHFPSLINYI